MTASVAFPFRESERTIGVVVEAFTRRTWAFTIDSFRSRRLRPDEASWSWWHHFRWTSATGDSWTPTLTLRRWLWLTGRCPSWLERDDRYCIGSLPKWDECINVSVFPSRNPVILWLFEGAVENNAKCPTHICRVISSSWEQDIWTRGLSQDGRVQGRPLFEVPLFFKNFLLFTDQKKKNFGKVDTHIPKYFWRAPTHNSVRRTKKF